MSHPNAELLRAHIDALARGDLPEAMSFYTDDAVFHYPGRNPLSGDYRGKDQVLALPGRTAWIAQDTPGGASRLPTVAAIGPSNFFALFGPTVPPGSGSPTHGCYYPSAVWRISHPWPQVDAGRSRGAADRTPADWPCPRGDIF